MCFSETHLTKYRVGECAIFQEGATTFVAFRKVIYVTICKSMHMSSYNHLICLISMSSRVCHDLMDDSLYSQLKQKQSFQKASPPSIIRETGISM